MLLLRFRLASHKISGAGNQGVILGGLLSIHNTILHGIVGTDQASKQQDVCQIQQHVGGRSQIDSVG
jgi:hypothetical protein